MPAILLVNGPNLNMLGKREPGIYGSDTLADVERLVSEKAHQLGYQIITFQSNHEGEIIDKIHEMREQVEGILINPGAFTHYSYAIRDAISAVSLPVVEIHISNVHARETFRHQSVIAPIAVGQVVGLGIKGYELALEGLVHYLQSQDRE
ncbi:MAG: type II 3-dehydroquinate dehydratase [Bacillaceae bacterium]|nr:type II 3-dehydroquinate dehydratase [Bacillaceae bacterium]